MLLISVFIILNFSMQVNACSDEFGFLKDIINENSAELATASIYDAGYTIVKDQEGNICTFSLDDKIIIAASYENGKRIHKEGDTSCDFTYTDGMLTSENRDGKQINYCYEYVEDIGANRYTGFCYDGNIYLYIYDDQEKIVGISDDKGHIISKYIYDKLNNITVLSEKEGIWVENATPEFIGNYNNIRWMGCYYDKETGLYYSNGVYDDICTGKIVGLKENESILSEENPFKDFVEVYSVDGYEETELVAEMWAQELLSSSSFNGSKASGYYQNSSITTVEIVARLIYGENTSNTLDQRAIAWVILNRYYSSRFPSTIREITANENQFGGVNSSIGRQAQSSKDSGWRNAVYLACLMLTDCSETCWNSASPKPTGISNQLFFRSANGLGKTTQIYESNGVLYVHYNSGDVVISNVCIAGKGTATTINGLEALCTNGKGGHNVFFYHE